MGQQNTWIWLLVLFFFGSSVFGVLSGFIVFALGFPYEWTFALTLVMLGSAAYLIYQRYTYLAWLLAVCLLFILFSALALFRAVGVQKPNIPEPMASYIEDDDNNIWLDDYGYSSLTLEAHQNRIVIPTYHYEYQNWVYLTVEFPTESTPGGQWAFERGEARVSGALNGVFAAEPSMNWVNAEEAEFLQDRELGQAYPYVVLSLPSSLSHRDQELEVEARLNILVPTAENESETRQLSRSVKVLLAGDTYYLRQSDYQTWKRARATVETPLWIVLVLGSVVAGGASLYLIRQGALEKMGAGDFILVVRRPSGLKLLGVEAHSLDKLKPEVGQGLEKGAVLGYVNPQSPAGRCGLRAGDVVIEVDSQAVNTPKDLQRMMAKFKKGQRAEVVVMRHHERTLIELKF